MLLRSPTCRALVNNRIFFQHPDLIRILRVNENVMDVMINTLGKRAQTQSSGQAPPAAAPAPASTPGQAAEAPHANKVGKGRRDHWRKKKVTLASFFRQKSGSIRCEEAGHHVCDLT